METKEYKAVPYGNGQYIFVDEAKPKKGDKVLVDSEFASPYVSTIKEITTNALFALIGDSDSNHQIMANRCLPIIAQSCGCGIEGVPCVELSEESIEEIADKWHSSAILNSHHIADRTSFIEGYKAAKGGYSEEQMCMLAAHVVDVIAGRKVDFMQTTPAGVAKSYIASLKPVVKSICIEIDAEEYVMAYNQAWVNNPDYGKPKRYTKKIDGKDVELIRCTVNYE